MTVIFLDFDGVLNNEGSFLYESRRRKQWKLQGVKGAVNKTFCHVNASNFQHILDTYKEVKVVVSSTWRIHFDVPALQGLFADYRIDHTRIIGCTPRNDSGNRGDEIRMWLNRHPEVTRYIVIDDNTDGIPEEHGEERFVKTDWFYGGLTFGHAQEAIAKLKATKKVKP